MLPRASKSIFFLEMFPGRLFSDPNKIQKYTLWEKRNISERYEVLEQKVSTRI